MAEDIDGIVDPTTEKKLHPLVADRVISGNGTFASWLAEWNRTQDARVRMGLLHCGLKDMATTPYEERVPAVLHYLNVANCHLGEWPFKNPGPEKLDAHRMPRHESYSFGGRYKRVEFIRQELAIKAYEELCVVFFQYADHLEPRETSWWGVARQPEIFNAVLDFFGVPNFRKNTHYDLHNLRTYGENRHDLIARKFLFDFASYFLRAIGEIARTGLNVADESNAIIEAARSRIGDLIAILRVFGKIHLLLDFHLEMEDDVLKILEEVNAGWSSVRIGNQDFTVHSLEEKVAADSPEAYVLCIYKIKQRERKRFTELAEVERQARELRHRHAELSSPNPP